MTDIDALQVQMTAWRRELHRHPEFGFEEHRTAALVARTLRGFGTLRRGSSNRAIARRRLPKGGFRRGRLRREGAGVLLPMQAGMRWGRAAG